MQFNTPFFTSVYHALYSLIAISSCLLLGYGINWLVSIIPASLYGMFIMAVGLKINLINADKMAVSINWIIKHMGVCFVPAGVGIMEHVGILKIHGVVLISLTIVTTIVLMVVVGHLFQYGVKKEKVTSKGEH